MGDLQEINGVGNSIEQQLNEIGIETVNDLANASLETLKEANIRGAERILEKGQNVGVQIKSGETVEEEQNDARFITTGIDDLDFILGGGLQGGFVIGVAGEHKAGKTQLALQCLAAAADETEGESVYIETEPNRFQVDRIKNLSKNPESYKNIHKIEAYSSDPDTDNLQLQRNSYKAVLESFEEVSVVVVDSFVSNFRLSGKFEGRGDLKERSNIIASHLKHLQQVSNHFDCPVLITLQIYGNPKQYDNSVPIWGGALLQHSITHLLFMSRRNEDIREAQLKGHPARPDSTAELVMPEDEPIQSANSQ